ncbi:MAG: RNA polymerase sigma-70 factor [Tannerella sp.]|nr:RNA polymerase sigma-70 factor [Tannerella sp.]
MKSSDIQSFNKIYHDYYKRLLNFACTYTQDFQMAEDFTTEAFMSYWENKDKLEPDSNIPAYLLTTIKHKCLNFLQRKALQLKIMNEMFDDENWKLHTNIITLKACEPEDLFVNDVKKIIKETLNTLPQKTHDIFVLSRFKDKTYKEIASIFNMTSKGVEFHISKAVELLRKNLKDYLILIISFLFWKSS